MAKGMALPIDVNPRGGAQIIEGDDYISSLVATGLSDCSDDNPFNDLGLGLEQVFSLAEHATTAKARYRIDLVFAELESKDLARLESVKFFDSTDGELSVTVAWINLEANERQEFTTSLQRER